MELFGSILLDLLTVNLHDVVKKETVLLAKLLSTCHDPVASNMS